MLKITAFLLAGLTLSGCATRGAVKITCNDFSSYSHPLLPSQLERDIQRDAHVWPTADRDGTVKLLALSSDVELSAKGDPMEAAMLDLVGKASDKSEESAKAGLVPGVQPALSVLLLSGGGQWGAYGAAFLDRLNERDGPAATEFGMITGVSTGGVQSLFVAINNRQAYEALVKAYSPEKESDVVNRPKARALAIVTGALAGLKPLRNRIEQALCNEGNAARGCPLIEQLAKAKMPVYIGFIKASTGEFLYADARAIAKSVTADPKNAQQCLAGIAMASAAMPAFYQQVKINNETYFDGGVRKSVFLAGVASRLEQAVVTRRKAKSTTPAPDLYVVRNGPTQLLGPKGLPQPDPKSDGKLNALDAALRAEAIVVNELEVGSIAALRLTYPSGTIRLTTADGYNAWPRPDGSKGCPKPDQVMFDPTFMACLRELGRTKANWPSPWIELSKLPLNARTTGAGN